MKTVRNLLAQKGSQVYAVQPETRVLDALKLMAEHNVGALLVMDKNRLAGIYSERDYARKVILREKNSRELAIGAIMTSPVITVQPRQTVHECMALMSRHHIRHLPVAEGERVVGVISISDVVAAIIAEREEELKTLERTISGEALLD